MYHPDVVAARLDVATEQIGWRPVYHTVEEVDMVNRRLEKIAERDESGSPTGKTTRPFTEQEKWWIRNERMLCACDAQYWITRYAYFKDRENFIQRFKPEVAQQIYFNVIAALEKRRAAIQLIILKARQLGMSTITELLVTHRILFSHGVNAVIASSAQQQTRKMQGMIFLAYDNLPYWLAPKFTSRVESDKGQLLFGGIASGVDFQHGSQTTGIARGSTPTIIHLSEVASYPNAADLIEASLFRAVHESPGVFMVLESTAEGDIGWWHDTWQSSVRGWHKGEARLCPLFLPWYAATDNYPTETWLRTRPIPSRFEREMLPETRAMRSKSQLFVHSSEILREVLGHEWAMPLKQAWYWEVEFKQAREKGKEKLWYQEMPCDPKECFQGSYDSVFGNDLLMELHNNRKKDYDVYGLSGHGIEEKFEPDFDDMEREPNGDLAMRKIVRYDSNKGDAFTWQMIPLRREIIEDGEDDDPDQAEMQADGKLLIFNHPEPGYDYTLGVDTGGGVGGDSTAIAVWRKGVRGMPDVQAAEFASAYVSHVESYAFVMVIAAYYGMHMRDQHPREPLVSIEQIAAVGDTVQPQMRLMGYGRFFLFHQYDTRKIQPKKSTKMGWRTFGWSRAVLIDGFVHSVKNAWATIHSPFLLREMKQFEVHIKGGKEKMEHADGDHDDRIFSSAIAIFTSHDMEAMVERGKNRPIPTGVKNLPDIDLEPIGIGTVKEMLGRAYAASEAQRITSSSQLEEYIANERLSY